MKCLGKAVLLWGLGFIGRVMADEWGFLEISTPWCQGALILRTPRFLGINQHKAAAKRKKNHFSHDMEWKTRIQMKCSLEWAFHFLKCHSPLAKENSAQGNMLSRYTRGFWQFNTIVGLLLWEAVKWEREVNVSFYRILYVIINAFGWGLLQNKHLRSKHRWLPPCVKVVIFVWWPRLVRQGYCVENHYLVKSICVETGHH